MAAESYYHLNAYPASSQQPPPGMYSGDNYNPAPSKPQLQTSTHSTYNALPPRPLSPPVKPNTQLLSKPHTTNSHTTPNERLKQRKYLKLKRYLRVGKVLVQAISTLLSAIMFGAMAFMSIKYYDTRNETRGGRTAWPKNPKLWPTFLLLIGAGITLIVSIITLISYCWFLKKAKRSWKLTVSKYAIHLGAWAIITILYRYEKDVHGSDNDLWGWTCSEEVAALQAEFNDVVGFSSLCNLQSSSWGTSLAEFLVKSAFAVGHFIIYRKTRDEEKQYFADHLGDATTDFVESFS
ncbi:hypothetical protein JMJ35_002910 [Cladonia borealis]|uniref:Uncharacterized protein n=1 Tax=Cladonia borealis TaxID=184061 RepID=A0AA39R3N8_9LECA|nr:hypothetical protein JMJ35_002910 [Cladonia borealis]